MVKDEWTYRGHDIEFDVGGQKNLYIDGERITANDLGTMVYDRDAIRNYIDEHYDHEGSSFDGMDLDEYVDRLSSTGGVS